MTLRFFFFLLFKSLSYHHSLYSTCLLLIMFLYVHILYSTRVYFTKQLSYYRSDVIFHSYNFKRSKLSFSKRTKCLHFSISSRVSRQGTFFLTNVNIMHVTERVKGPVTLASVARAVRERCTWHNRQRRELSTTRSNSIIGRDSFRTTHPVDSMQPTRNRCYAHRNRGVLVVIVQLHSCFDAQILPVICEPCKLLRSTPTLEIVHESVSFLVGQFLL